MVVTWWIVAFCTVKFLRFLYCVPLDNISLLCVNSIIFVPFPILPNVGKYSNTFRISFSYSGVINLIVWVPFTPPGGDVILLLSDKLFRFLFVEEKRSASI